MSPRFASALTATSVDVRQASLVHALGRRPGDCEAREPALGERANETVELRKAHGVDPLEHSLDTSACTRGRSSRQAALLAIQIGHVEIDREHERQRHERHRCQDGLPGDVTESGEDGCVHDEVGLRVQVAAGECHAPGDACELAVRVVQQRLQLQEQRGGEQLPAGQSQRGDEPGDRVGEDDGRRCDSGSRENRHEQVRERPEDDRENELAPGPSRLCRRCRCARDVLGRDRHLPPIVDTGVVAAEGWTEVDGALERTFELPSFLEALEFVNRVGALAEAEDHHPDIAISYRKVTLRWWTHTAGGITDRDRELARRTDSL